jgi:hypothetical protein
MSPRFFPLSGVALLVSNTNQCENENIAIEIIDPLPNVYCGPCGIEITDKQTVAE